MTAHSEVPSQASSAFEGFELPQYTQIPNLIIDYIMPHLSGNEFKVLMYIARRTLGFHRPHDSISLSQLVNGITARDGRVLNRGTGLSKATVARCLNKLEKRGYIERTRASSEEKGDLPTTYSLRFKQDPPVSQNETPPRVSKRDTPVSQNETHKRNNIQKKQQHVVVALLTKKGIGKRVAARLAKEHDEAYVRQKIAYLDFLLNYKPDTIKNPKGWLRKAIEDNYGEPDGFVTQEEIEKRREEERRQQQALEQARKHRAAAAAAKERAKRQAERERVQAAREEYGTTEKEIDLWTFALGDMKNNLTPAQYGLVADSHLLTTRDGTAMIGVKSKMIGEMMISRLKRLILPYLQHFDPNVQTVQTVVINGKESEGGEDA